MKALGWQAQMNGYNRFAQGHRLREEYPHDVSKGIGSRCADSLDRHDVGYSTVSYSTLFTPVDLLVDLTESQ